MLEVFYHRTKFARDLISPAAGAAKNIEFFVCLFVCLFVTLLNARDCAPDFAMKTWEYKTILIPLDSGRFAVCTVFNFLRLLPIGDTTKCRSPKIWVFRSHRTTE